jgi:NADP-dependent 3-hydroxy acid dehydrogenase YdfG
MCVNEAMPRVWFITSSTSGFGRALIDAVRSRGERVIATARRPEALAELESDDLAVLELDVTREDAWRSRQGGSRDRSGARRQ